MSLPVHDDGIVERFADGHIAVIGHRCEDEDLNPHKEVCVEKLCHADFIGGGLFLHQKVSHEFGCHSGVVEEI